MTYETLESGIADADTQSGDDAARIALRRTFEGNAAESPWGTGTAEHAASNQFEQIPPLSVLSSHGAFSPPRAVNANYGGISVGLRQEFVL